MGTRAESPVLRRFGEVLLRSPKYLLLAANLGRDERLSPAQRAAAMAAGGYALLPFDLLPGIIPVLGQLDDLTVMLGGLRAVLRGIPPAVEAEHLARAGLTAERLDTDLAIVGETARWLAHGGARLVARAARSAGSAVARGWRALIRRRSGR